MCGSAVPMQAVEPGPAETSTAISLAVGRSHSLLLSGNPTTGFTWNIVSVSSDAATAKADILPPPATKKGEPMLCGAPPPRSLRSRE